jgi:multidrug efflux system outer membrane protein
MKLHRITRIGAAAALLATVTACTTVGPDYRIPSAAAIRQPAAGAPFAEAAAAAFRNEALPAEWWQLYRDEQLDRLIEKAFAANTDLRVAAANLARTRAVLDETRDVQRPTVGIDAAVGYGRPSAAALGLGEPIPDDWLQDVGVGVSYRIDLFGKIARAVEAAGADAQAMQAAYEVTRVTVAAATTRAYVDACAAGRQIAVAQHSLDLQQEFVGLTEKRVAAGRSTPLDSSRARAQLEQLRAALPPLLAEHRTAQYRLAVLTGELPGVLSREIDRCGAPPQLSAPIPVGDGAALLRRRPDIRQAERGLAAATARIGVATADLYPSITLGLSGGSTGTLAQFGAANTLRWSLGPLISWTLPATGSARSRIAQATAGSDAALAHFDGVVLNALREVESALAVYARELDRNATLKAARDQSALAAGQTAALYRYGRTDFLAKLDADRTLAGAESALAASDAQVAIDQVTLFQALAGGWQRKR